MKQAAGEANLTVVAIILVAVIVAVATPLISALMKRQVWRTCCTDQGGIVKNTKCELYENGELITTVSKEDLIGEDRSCVQIDITNK